MEDKAEAGVSRQRHAEINVFTVGLASGLLYEVSPNLDRRGSLLNYFADIRVDYDLECAAQSKIAQ